MPAPWPCLLQVVGQKLVALVSEARSAKQRRLELVAGGAEGGAGSGGGATGGPGSLEHCASK